MRFAVHGDTDIRADDCAHGAPGTPIFSQVGGVKPFAIQQTLINGDNVLGTNAGAEFAAFAPFLVNIYSASCHP